MIENRAMEFDPDLLIFNYYLGFLVAMLLQIRFQTCMASITSLKLGGFVTGGSC